MNDIDPEELLKIEKANKVALESQLLAQKVGPEQRNDDIRKMIYAELLRPARPVNQNYEGYTSNSGNPYLGNVLLPGQRSMYMGNTFVPKLLGADMQKNYQQGAFDVLAKTLRVPDVISYEVPKAQKIVGNYQKELDDLARRDDLTPKELHDKANEIKYRYTNDPLLQRMTENLKYRTKVNADELKRTAKQVKEGGITPEQAQANLLSWDNAFMESGGSGDYNEANIYNEYKYTPFTSGVDTTEVINRALANIGYDANNWEVEGEAYNGFYKVRNKSGGGYKLVSADRVDKAVQETLDSDENWKAYQKDIARLESEKVDPVSFHRELLSNTRIKETNPEFYAQLQNLNPESKEGRAAMKQLAAAKHYTETYESARRMGRKAVVTDTKSNSSSGINFEAGLAAFATAEREKELANTPESQVTPPIDLGEDNTWANFEPTKTDSNLSIEFENDSFISPGLAVGSPPSGKWKVKDKKTKKTVSFNTKKEADDYYRKNNVKEVDNWNKVREAAENLGIDDKLTNQQKLEQLRLHEKSKRNLHTMGVTLHPDNRESIGNSEIKYAALEAKQFYVNNEPMNFEQFADYLTKNKDKIPEKYKSKGGKFTVADAKEYIRNNSLVSQYQTAAATKDGKQNTLVNASVGGINYAVSASPESNRAFQASGQIERDFVKGNFQTVDSDGVKRPKLYTLVDGSRVRFYGLDKSGSPLFYDPSKNLDSHDLITLPEIKKTELALLHNSTLPTTKQKSVDPKQTQKELKNTRETFQMLFGK